MHLFFSLLNPCYQRVNAIVSKNIKKGKKRFGKEKVKLVSLPTRNARNVGSTKVHNLVFVFFERELKFFLKKLVRLKKNCTFAPALRDKRV